jgi:hypothetical protein
MPENNQKPADNVEVKDTVEIKESKDSAPSDPTIAKVTESLKKQSDIETDYERPLYNLSDADFSSTVMFDSDVDDYDDGDESGAEITVEPKEDQTKTKAVPFDLSTVKRTTARNELDIEGDIKHALYAGKSAFQIVAAQSGYIAKISPLVNSDFVDLYNSSLNSFESKKLVFNILYDKILETSAGKMTFDEWLSNTSIGDLETFYYGLYCSTFGDDGVASMDCPYCRKTIQFPLSCRNLVKTADKEKMKERLDQVSKNATTANDMKTYSLLSEVRSYKLPKSGIGVKLKMPSLHDMLVFLRAIPDKVAQAKSNNPSYISTILSIGSFFVPSRLPGGDIIYDEITDSQKIIRIVDEMDIDDANALTQITTEMIENYHITYSVKDVKCPACGKEIGDIPVNIERILFTLIFRKM